MSKINPKLVILAVVLLGATLAIKVLPMVASGYAQLKSDKESLNQELVLLQNLVEREQKLGERADEIRALVENIDASIFAVPENLFGSEVQSIVRSIASRNGVEVREMEVADMERFEDWLKVSQEMDFVINQRNMLPFLGALKAHQPRLYVREFSITRSRQQFLGSITVEAFSRQFVE